MKSAGYSLIEVLIGISLMTLAVLAASSKIKAVKTVLKDTSHLMALDASESYLGDFLKSKEVFDYSLNKSKNSELRDCINKDRPCKDGSKYAMDLYREGDKTPFTGSSVFYDENGEPCNAKDCRFFTIQTFARIVCMEGRTCSSPGLLMEAQMIRADGKATKRTIVREVERNISGKFPRLSLSCPDRNSVLRGIGLRGDPLCVPRNEIQFVDADKAANSGQLNVVPVDCSLTDSESYVQGINRAGVIQCANRFW